VDCKTTPKTALATDHAATGNCTITDKPTYVTLAGCLRAPHASPLTTDPPHQPARSTAVCSLNAKPSLPRYL